MTRQKLPRLLLKVCENHLQVKSAMKYAQDALIASLCTNDERIDSGRYFVTMIAKLEVTRSVTIDA